MIFTLFNPIFLASMGSGASNACASAADRAAAGSSAPIAKDNSTADITKAAAAVLSTSLRHWA